MIVGDPNMLFLASDGFVVAQGKPDAFAGAVDVPGLN